MTSSLWMPAAMNSAVDAQPLRGGKIGAHGIADGEDARERPACARAARRRARAPSVGGGMRLAGPEHRRRPAARTRRRCSRRTGSCTAPTSTTRSGLAHTNGSRARHALLDQRAVVLDGLVAVVLEPGADDGLGLRERHVRARQAHDRGRSRARWDRPSACAGSPSRRCGERDVAGGDDGVPGIAAHAGLLQHALDAGGRDRRIGDQDHRAALGAEARQRRAGLRVGPRPLCTTPQTSQKMHVVARQQRRRRWR